MLISKQPAVGNFRIVKCGFNTAVKILASPSVSAMVMKKQETLEGEQLKSPREEHLSGLGSGLPEGDVDSVLTLNHCGGCGTSLRLGHETGSKETLQV